MAYESKKQPEPGKEYNGLTQEELSNIEPKFRNPDELPPEALTDPDYAIKQLEKFNGNRLELEVRCSKCHHCR